MLTIAASSSRDERNIKDVNCRRETRNRRDAKNSRVANNSRDVKGTVWTHTTNNFLRNFVKIIVRTAKNSRRKTQKE
jgi:hypothetical protein